MPTTHKSMPWKMTIFVLLRKISQYTGMGANSFTLFQSNKLLQPTVKASKY